MMPKMNAIAAGTLVVVVLGLFAVDAQAAEVSLGTDDGWGSALLVGEPGGSFEALPAQAYEDAADGVLGDDFEATHVPEPNSMALLGLGGLLILRRPRRR